MVNRRQFLAVPPMLGAGVLLGGALGTPRSARAATAADRKFIFVFAQGGWDPTRVFADGFDHANVAMERRAERATVGGVRFVDHPDRPSVRTFFEQHAAQSVIVEGVLVRSIAHETCTRITMTGTPAGISPDWPAAIGNAARERFTVPHMVLGGPSFPGCSAMAAARAGMTGHAFLSGDACVTLASQSAVAVKALSLGVARCITLSADAGATGWDSHVDNDKAQSPLWEGLFSDLDELMRLLKRTPGKNGRPLAEETTVVVVSEMGRTPGLNPLNGKDHWPYTSMLLVGSGLSGGRCIGGWDSRWYGRPVDAGSGEVSEAGVVLSAESIGATLLALADIDPAEFVTGVSPLSDLIA